MKKIVLGLLLFAISGYANNFTNHQILLGVHPINEIDLTKEVVELVIDKAVHPDQTSAQSTIMKYSVTTNEDGKKIIGYINERLPDGSELLLKMDPPKRSVSLGDVSLKPYPRDLVTGINKRVGSNLGMTYTFNIDKSCELDDLQLRLIYLILTDM